MKLELKYGEGTLEVEVPDSADVTVLEPNQIAPVPSVEQAVIDALADAQAKDAGLVPDLKEGQKVAIAVPDETRPLPVKKVLPIVLKWLYEHAPALKPEQVTVIVGGGLHPPLEKADLDRLVPPEVAPGCTVISHDAVNSPMKDFGTTSSGSPVQVNQVYGEADYKIVIGQIDPHQFVGFTGGAKGVIIGCGSAKTIEHNHGLMFNEQARVGVLAENPVRQDLNEAGELVGINLAVNMVMAPNKDVIKVMIGKPLDTLAEGTKSCAALYGVGIDEKFDIVIASCGGYPKDICLYQAQKGLNLASQAVKPGGKILLLAAAPQGVGDDVYLDYVSQFETPQEVVSDFRKKGFKMGAHKAFLFGRTLNQFDVAVTSELDPAILKQCQLRAARPEEALGEWLDGFEGTPRIGVIMNANTMYYYEKGE